jgi:hypothetical protein
LKVSFIVRFRQDYYYELSSTVSGRNEDVEAAAIERAVQRLQPIDAPIGQLGPAELSASRVSTFEKGCRFVSGLFPLRFAHLEKLFSDGMLWHVAELIEDCQNGRTTNVTLL